MVIRDINRFNELAESLGNRYLAVQFVSMWTRELGSEYRDYQIAESKLLQWVVTGKCPYLEHQLNHRKRETDEDHINDFLSWVNDEEVSNEVKFLYKRSVKNKKLTYCNRKDFSSGRASRANVLLRMLWYSTT